MPLWKARPAWEAWMATLSNMGRVLGHAGRRPKLLGARLLGCLHLALCAGDTIGAAQAYCCAIARGLDSPPLDLGKESICASEIFIGRGGGEAGTATNPVIAGAALGGAATRHGSPVRRRGFLPEPSALNTRLRGAVAGGLTGEGANSAPAGTVAGKNSSILPRAAAYHDSDGSPRRRR